MIQCCIDFGKDAKSQLTLRNEKKEHIAKRRVDREVQISSAIVQIQEFEQSMMQKTQYHCDKIQTSCPYVEMINGSAFKTLRIQLDNMKTDLDSKKLHHTDVLHEQSLLAEDPIMISLLADAEILKEMLMTIQRKLREDQYKRVIQFDKDIASLQIQRSSLQTKQSQIMTLKEQRITLQSEHQSLQNQIKDHTTVLINLQ